MGAAIARALAAYRLRCVLLDAASDVATGTSKANTAILHTGFDAKPGTLESRLVRRGHALLSAYAERAGIAVEHTGALLVAWTAEELAALPAIAARAGDNGYHGTRTLVARELYALEPHLAPGALGALAVPDEGIVDPFTTPLAFATEAVLNGVELRLHAAVDARRPGPDDTQELVTAAGVVRARWVVNAAGLHADVIDRLFGHAGFTVTPRRGELIVFDKPARGLLRHVILPVPTATTKGVLVAPTVFGNVVLGPTAEDVRDRDATGTTAAGLAGLLDKGARLLPALLAEEVTAMYVGLRAATEHADYQIAVHPDARYACVGGIRSTGLTAALAIAEHVVAGLADAGLVLEPRADVRTVRMPPLGDALLRPHRSADAIAADPDHGRIVCHCERVTRAEILAATSAPIPARSLDGVRRRTRALLGRCQGFYCLATVARLLADAHGTDVATVLGLDP